MTGKRRPAEGGAGAPTGERVRDDDKKADGEDWGEKMMAPKLDGEAMQDGECEATREFLKLSIPRQFRTKDKDYHEHGHTRGCPGCKSLLSGKTWQQHSDPRRARMAEAMAGSKRVEDARERKRKLVEEALKAEELKYMLKTTLDDGRAQRAPRPFGRRQRAEIGRDRGGGHEDE